MALPRPALPPHVSSQISGHILLQLGYTQPFPGTSWQGVRRLPQASARLCLAGDTADLCGGRQVTAEFI